MNRVIMAALAAFFASPVLADESVETRSTLRFGEWTITAHQTNVTHEFTHCVASTTYTAATAYEARQMRATSLFFMVKIMRTGALGLAIGADKWHMTVGSTHQISFRFDDGNEFHVDMDVNDPLFMSSLFNANANWYKAMMDASSVQIWIDDANLGKFRLANSYGALEKLAACAASNVKQENADTFGDRQEPEQRHGKTETFGPAPKTTDTF